MNNDVFVEIIRKELALNASQVSKVILMLDEGLTIPFISRYRKEATGNLDEVAIQKIKEKYQSLAELSQRKEYIISVVREQDKLTAQLEERINLCWNTNELEDIYLPFKPKKRTRAEIARNKGLEPLAKIIMAQHNDDILYKSRKFIREQVETVEDALAGAMDIIAEWVSENETSRNIVRRGFQRSGCIRCHVIKGKEEEASNFSNYFDCKDSLRKVASHRYLAMRRGEEEGFLRITLEVEEDEILHSLERLFIRQDTTSSEYIKNAIRDSYKRLIKPSIDTEIYYTIKQKADESAISMFAQNLRQLLFAPPLGNKRVMGVDPGYRTGCKIVCLDEQGDLLHNDVIYPTPPRNEIALSKKKISQLVESYNIEAIAIGNGTASRETEKLFASLHYNKDIKVFVVSENGASIYSASKLAREEFPNYDVTVRGAVSIGRRLMDPLAELVKIDPKSIGVGQYQHDVDQNILKTSLDFTVESCVNKVGVNLNCASKELLTYVSGLGPQLAKNIVEYRTENGAFKSRVELKNVPRLGDKAYKLCAGFLRIPGADNILDNTAVHPESYSVVRKMAEDYGVSIEELVENKSLRSSIDLNKYVTDKFGLPTLNDIMDELEKPGRDPRNKVKVLEFDERVHTIDDIQIGMILNGIVTNITQFGAFVDFGIKENGLLHISEMSDSFISSPLEVLSLHQHLKVKIIDVDKSRKRVALSLKGI